MDPASTRYRTVQRGERFSSLSVSRLGTGDEVRFEKHLYSMPEELIREQERRARDAKPSQ